jgi:hypothetical protein
MRSSRRVALVGTVITVLLSAATAPAAAQDAGTVPVAQAAQPALVVQPLGIVIGEFPPAAIQPFVLPRAVPANRRPSALVPLYGTLAVLQGLDVHSTMRGVGSANGREANPVMKPFVNNGAAFLAVKTSATVGVIWMSEKVWRRHRKAAVVSVFIVNAVMAGVVANNYRVNR